MDCLFPKMRIEYVIDWYKRSKKLFFKRFLLDGVIQHIAKKEKGICKKKN